MPQGPSSFMSPSMRVRIGRYRLTVEALAALEESGLTKREVIRRLRTSPSQFYRLLDTTYFGKSVERMLALLWVLGREVDLFVRRSDPSSAAAAGQRQPLTTAGTPPRLS